MDCNFGREGLTVSNAIAVLSSLSILTDLGLNRPLVQFGLLLVCFFVQMSVFYDFMPFVFQSIHITH